MVSLSQYAVGVGTRKILFTSQFPHIITFVPFDDQPPIPSAQFCFIHRDVNFVIFQIGWKVALKLLSISSVE